MKKFVAFLFLATLTLSGLGCQHTAGICDCAAPESSAAATSGPANPYPVVGGEKK